MRKVILILGMIFLLCGCSEEKVIDHPQELSVNEVLTKLNSEKSDSFLLYLTSDNCYSCEEYEKVIEDLEEEKPFEIYYLKIDLEENDEATLQAMRELDVTIGDIKELPTTYYFYQGNLLKENCKLGYLNKEELREWLKSLHILH